MKFKLIFILFNVTLLLFLGALVLIPFYVLGSAFSSAFWKMNWPFIPVWFILFAVLNIFYFINRELFMLLEKEDWPALVRYLEARVIQKGRYSLRLVRLLANSYLVLSDSKAVMSLENKVAIAKPSLINANALVFGTARILGNDISGAVRFFETRKDTVKAGFKEWTHWYYGFALLLDHQLEKAAAEFSFLASFSKDAVITGLSSYFLSNNMTYVLPEKEGEFQKISSTGKERVRAALSKIEVWRREVSLIATEIHAAAVAKYLEDTGNWLYS